MNDATFLFSFITSDVINHHNHQHQCHIMWITGTSTFHKIRKEYKSIKRDLSKVGERPY